MAQNYIVLSTLHYFLLILWKGVEKSKLMYLFYTHHKIIIT